MRVVLEKLRNHRAQKKQNANWVTGARFRRSSWHRRTNTSARKKKPAENVTSRRLQTSPTKKSKCRKLHEIRSRGDVNAYAIASVGEGELCWILNLQSSDAASEADG
jgi:hypothetical protein